MPCLTSMVQDLEFTANTPSLRWTLLEALSTVTWPKTDVWRTLSHASTYPHWSDARVLFCSSKSKSNGSE